MRNHSLLAWRGLFLREVRENKAQLIYTPAIFLFLGLLLLAEIASAVFPDIESRSLIIDQFFTGLESMDISSFAPLFTTASGPYLFVMMLTAMIYLSKSLYADRRDQSYLFWQSMPVSDTKTVLSKVVIALFVIPLFYFAALLLALALVLIVIVAYAMMLGVELAGISELISLLISGALYTFLSSMLGMFWLLPVVGWILLFSAFAPRAPLLWAIAVAFLLNLVERVFIGSNTIESWINSRSNPWQYLAFGVEDLLLRLTSYEMLFGFLIAAVLILGAVGMRRFSD